jgi:AAA family ATPase
MVFEASVSGFNKRSFRVRSIDSQDDILARYDAKATTCQILQPNEGVVLPIREEYRGKLILTGVPGLAHEVMKLNTFFKVFNLPDGKLKLHHDYMSCGVVVHGGRGTGKSFILDQIANTRWGKVYRIDPTAKSADIQATFKQARLQQPSIILIDRLEILINKDRPNHNTVIDALGRELDELSAIIRETQALPKVILIATCLDYLTDIPYELRKVTRLQEGIRLSLPDVGARREILESMELRLLPETKEISLSNLALKTHAYNIHDLATLVERAKLHAERRFVQEGNNPEPGDNLPLTWNDFALAFESTRPAVMHDINLRPPTVHWEDIGGNEDVKRELKRMIKFSKVGYICLGIRAIAYPLCRTLTPSSKKLLAHHQRAFCSMARRDAPRRSLRRLWLPRQLSTSLLSKARSC